MEISILGNSEFFISPIYSDVKESFVSYNINGVFDNEYFQNTFCFKRDKLLLKEFSWKNLYSFSVAIRGFSFEKTLELLKQENLSNYYTNKMSLTYQEIGIIKALFNSILWLEYPLSTKNILTIKDKIYDNFILDITEELGYQRDIYFIPESFNTEEKMVDEINLLMKINLLCKLSIIDNDFKIEAYFLPFIKPGINFNNISLANKDLLSSAYKLYKTVLSLRESRIKNFINKKWK